MKFDIHKKEQEGLLYENGAGEKIVTHSKLKLWTFFWGHAEREWPFKSSDFSHTKTTLILKHTHTHISDPLHSYIIV